tara:strand:+ start:746 stop:1102 length:357 start_codon:yes stop_codon:yes gene_type:complete
MKKSPLKLIGAATSAVRGGGAPTGSFMPPKDGLIGGLRGMINPFIPQTDKPCDCGEEVTSDFEAQRINEIDQRILNPMETTMGGNIQPGVYNTTGFSNGMVDNANQIFNTPEERNKII